MANADANGRGAVAGKVVGVNGNMVTVDFDGDVLMNEVAYVALGDKRLKSEVIRIRGQQGRPAGVRGDPRPRRSATRSSSPARCSRCMLGPGLLGQIFDGLQNPLPQLAEQAGFFLERGVYLHGPAARTGSGSSPQRSRPATRVSARRHAGHGAGGHLHSTSIMVPFGLRGTATRCEQIAPAGEYTIEQDASPCSTDATGQRRPVTMLQPGR